MADHLLLHTGDSLLLTDGTSVLLLQGGGPTPPTPPPPYNVVDTTSPHVQDAPTANLQWMADSHGADAPGIGYIPAEQYRSD